MGLHFSRTVEYVPFDFQKGNQLRFHGTEFGASGFRKDLIVEVTARIPNTKK